MTMSGFFPEFGGCLSMISERTVVPQFTMMKVTTAKDSNNDCIECFMCAL